MQAQTNPADDASDVLRVRTDLVSVPLFVTDERGRRMTGFGLKDFSLQIDGRDFKPSYFSAGTERVRLAFSLDASGSAREIISRQTEAALSLFARFGPQSSVTVWHFGSRPQLVADFTTESERVRNAFHPAPVAEERTAIFDAALAAARAFDTARSEEAERRILILISDGLDTASHTKAQAVIDEALHRSVSIYVIHLPLFEPRDGRLRPRPATKGFRALATATGGRYFMVGDARAALDARSTIDLSPVFRAIEEDLSGQYVLGFYPDEAARDGRFHRLSIKLNAHGSGRLRVQQLREGFTLR